MADLPRGVYSTRVRHILSTCQIETCERLLEVIEYMKTRPWGPDHLRFKPNFGAVSVREVIDSEPLLRRLIMEDAPSAWEMIHG